MSSVYGEATDKLADQPGDRLYAMLTAAAEAAEVPGFAIIDRNVIGTFTYAKLPMVRDLQNAAKLLADSDVVAAIAGDPDAQELLSATTTRRPCLTRRRRTTRCSMPTPPSAARSRRSCPAAAW